MVRKKRVVHEVGNAKCVNCHKPVVKGSKFCKHCGASQVHHKAVKVHTCPSCKGILEEFSRFCKHCGANIDAFAHSNFVRILLYFIVFLVLALALLIFFSPTLVDFEGPVVDDNSGSYDASNSMLKMNNAVCSWKDDSFDLCATVNWAGDTNDYAKCSFAGNLNDKKWTNSPFTCCQKVDDKEGVKLIRSFIFDENGNAYGDEGLSVSCMGRPSQEVPAPVLSTREYEQSFWLSAKVVGGQSAYASGSKLINFPGKVKSCEIDGRWVTDANNADGSDAAYCVGGEGIFFGTADLFGQSIISDPGLFYWAGYDKRILDPTSKIYDDYAFYASLCDDAYISHGSRYYARGKLDGFQTNQLKLDWNYFANFPRPEVDIFMDLKCQIY
ncbi:MAG: zinc ribbon domain-containing protein [Nanoarchaeota archaeon]|nr:zinc ribbon domain-containing protein [Nanoarchaeota archaeon]